MSKLALLFFALGGAWVGLAVFGVTFLFTLGEVALVAWAANYRQDVEKRRAEKE